MGTIGVYIASSGATHQSTFSGHVQLCSSVLPVKRIVSSVLESYRLALVANQEQWQ